MTVHALTALAVAISKHLVHIADPTNWIQNKPKNEKSGFFKETGFLDSVFYWSYLTSADRRVLGDS